MDNFSRVLLPLRHIKRVLQEALSVWTTFHAFCGHYAKLCAGKTRFARLASLGELRSNNIPWGPIKKSSTSSISSKGAPIVYSNPLPLDA